MALQNKKILSAVACIFTIGILLSACGRRGALEEPPGAKVVNEVNPDQSEAKPEKKPDRPFILDFLI